MLEAYASHPMGREEDKLQCSSGDTIDIGDWRREAVRRKSESRRRRDRERQQTFIARRRQGIKPSQTGESVKDDEGTDKEEDIDVPVVPASSSSASKDNSVVSNEAAGDGAGCSCVW